MPSGVLELGRILSSALDPIPRLRMFLPTALAALLGLGGCATAPINLPITQVDRTAGHRFQTREQHARDKEDIVVLAFSGGGTRAAAFSYGVLEALRDTEVIGRNGQRFDGRGSALRQRA